MSTGKLNIAFIWHMHQPFYKNLLTNEYVMPWVRLHAIKDYYNMVSILESFPNIHQTFNLVPSLIEQILDYVNNKADDNILKLTRKPSKDLTGEEKIDILTKLFMANWETMIKIYPRYRQLLEKRGEQVSMEKLKLIQKSLTNQDFLDLQVWYNLAWFDPVLKKTDNEIMRLIAKNEKFTEEDKMLLINKQLEIMGKILPLYKKFMEKGQIEISISPYYHPILPLLVNMDIAKIASPYINLPCNRANYPEDARWQVENAVKMFNDIFGAAPRGMWPSEGSVSEDIIPIIAESGIKWIATDERILAHSINQDIIRDSSGEVLNPEVLYKSYIAEKNGRSLNIIFRDQKLSDKIGFVYSKWNSNDAVNNFLYHLHKVRNNLRDDPCKYLVSIILDGENAWEYYPDDGREFLLSLYDRLNNDTSFQCVTVSEYLDVSKNKEKLHYLFPGSWINNSFNIWIGHQEDNLAWDYLKTAREKLVNFQSTHSEKEHQEILSRAWKEIYIAEGSDWCWWYGDEFSSENDIEFDNLFRQHLMNVYQIIGAEIPSHLYIPIKKTIDKIRPVIEPSAFIDPIIDGKNSHYYEWLSAGIYDIYNVGGAMHRAQTIIKKIYYGFNQNNIFIRIDPEEKNDPAIWEDIKISIYILNPKSYKIDITLNMSNHIIYALLYKASANESWETIKKIESIAVDKIIELKIPNNDILFKIYDTIEFMIIVLQNNLELERLPVRGLINFSIPKDASELLIWQI